MVELSTSRSSEGAVTTTAIVSGKGGTGKSLTSCCVSYILAHCGFKVLLIDTDLFTAGLTFFVGSLFPRRVETSLWDVMIDEVPPSDISTVLIPDKFCNGNLYFLPAVSKKSISPMELDRHHITDSLESYSTALSLCIKAAQAGQQFDYIILDTRGGSDATSIGAALVAGGFIMVTEADKTSWEVGGRLLDAIESNSTRVNNAINLGFILNKNVLPDQAIVQFLRHQWRSKHLATLPLDAEAIRYFQEDKVPVAEEQTIPFSEALIPMIRKTFLDERWSSNQTSKLIDLEELAGRRARIREEDNKRKHRIERLSFILRAYAVGAAVLISVFLSISGRYILDDLRVSIDAMFGLVSIVLAAVTLVDSRVLNALFGSRRTAANKTEEKR